MATRKERRRTFPVVSSLQYRFLAMTMIYGFVVVCFLLFTAFAPDVAEMLDKSLKLEIRGYAAHRLLNNQFWVWGAVLLLVIALGVHSFRAFHKVMGPLHRFRSTFEQVGDGNLLLRINVRERDYLETEAEALNNMLDKLRRKLRSVREATDVAFKSMDEIEQSMSKGNEMTETQRDLLRTHREHIEKIATLVQFFRLEEGQETTGSGQKG
jgi:methyl-accepting chemotaxis protein